MDAYAVSQLYVRLQYLLKQLVTPVRREISDDSYSCDYVGGKAVQVGKEEKWVPRSATYDLLAGARVSVANNVRKLYSNLQNVVTALGQISLDSRSLGLPVDEDYECLRKESVALLANKQEKMGNFL
jgi:hypothetical protein